MSFFNNLGQKISDVSQTTIKKTKDLADTAKLNLNISEEERKIDTAYEQIGKWYVEKHREDAEEDVKTWLDAIAVSEARIKECRGRHRKVYTRSCYRYDMLSDLPPSR